MVFVLLFYFYQTDTDESADEEPGPSGDAVVWMNLVGPDAGPPPVEFIATPGPKITLPTDSE